MPRPAIDRLLLESLAPAGPEAVDLEPADWETLWVKARTHCLTPYLDERWRRSGIMARVPAGVAERFASARRMNFERNRRLAAQLAEAAAALEAGGVPALAVKGLDLAERCYGDLGLRVLYDLDLVIRPGDRRRALELLGALGYVAFEGSGARPGADLVWRRKQYAWDAERIFDPERPCLLDLQTRLWEPRWHGFRVETLDLWPDHRIAELGGARVRVPSDEKLLVELAVHYAFNALESHARLMHLLDAALLVEARAGALDWDRILGEAEASRVARFCFLTLELARIICRAPVPEKARRRLRDAAPPAIVRWLERHAEAAPLAMDLYARDRALIYSLHWAMASGWGERAEVLLHSLEAPWREAAQARRYGAFARRMGARFRHLAGRVGRPPR